VSDPNVLKLTPQRRTRRKIIPSPLKVQHTQKSALSESTQLNDSFSKELQPIVYTPEDCKKAQDLFPSLTRTSSQSANVMNDNSQKALCRIESPLSRTECKQGLYSTSTLCDSIRGLKNKWPEQEPLASSKSSVHRYKSRVLYTHRCFLSPKSFKLLTFSSLFILEVYFINEVSSL
jgi:kinesin family protein 18/19